LQIDLEYLRRHYAALSDEALREIDETELVDQARRIYDEEFAQRGLIREEEAASDDDDVVATPLEETGGTAAGHLDQGPEPDWLGDAAVAASFVSSPGSVAPPDAAVDASDALHAAGIPCYVSTDKVDPPQVSPRPQYEFRLMVPNEWNLEARSVLDKEIFNREIEAYWKMHFQMLSDDELRGVDLEVLLAGLKDRIARVTRAYNEELKERQ
jgi:hypothetical protein